MTAYLSGCTPLHRPLHPPEEGGGGDPESRDVDFWLGGSDSRSVMGENLEVLNCPRPFFFIKQSLLMKYPSFVDPTSLSLLPEPFQSDISRSCPLCLLASAHIRDVQTRRALFVRRPCARLIEQLSPLAACAKPPDGERGGQWH